MAWLAYNDHMDGLEQERCNMSYMFLALTYRYADTTLNQCHVDVHIVGKFLEMSAYYFLILPASSMLENFSEGFGVAQFT